MKQCNCEHWETCPICYPQGFDENGSRKPVGVPPSREERLSRIKDLEAALTRLMDYTPRQYWVGGPEFGGWVPNGEALLKVLDQCDAALKGEQP